MADLPQARYQCDEQSQPATSPATPAETKDECHFFKIPPELRIIIYADVLSTVDFVQDQGPQARLLRPALLETCKAFQVEAAPLYKNRMAEMVTYSARETARSWREYTKLLGPAMSNPDLMYRLMCALEQQMARSRKFHTDCYDLVQREVMDLHKAIGSAVGPLEHKTAIQLKKSTDELENTFAAFFAKSRS